MPIILDSATRQRPAPCIHYDAELLVDGVLVHVQIAANELDAPPTPEERETYLRLWARYHRAKGKTLAQMVGQTVIGDIL